MEDADVELAEALERLQTAMEVSLAKIRRGLAELMNVWAESIERSNRDES